MAEDKQKRYEDPFGTLRTAYYRRPYPFAEGGDYGDDYRDSPLADYMNSSLAKTIETVMNSTPAQTARTIVSGSMHPEKTRDKLASDFLKMNPSLARTLTELGKARLRQIGSDAGWAKDKHYGWGHRVRVFPQPEESPYFKLEKDEAGNYFVDDQEAAKDLINLDLAKKLKLNENGLPVGGLYEKTRKAFQDWVDNPYEQEFVPMTREQAEAAKIDFYPTTAKFLESLTGRGLIDPGYTRILYDAAQKAVNNILAEDAKADMPEFGIARARLSDTDKDGNKIVYNVYERPNKLKHAVKNFVFPNLNAVMGDPELWEKTNPVEAGVRLAEDAGERAVQLAAPYVGARLATMFRPAWPLVSSVVGGALGGAGSYGVGRGINEIMDRATGYGTKEYPMSLADLGLEMAMGGVGGATMNKTGIKAYRKLRNEMASNPSAVTSEDIREALKLSRQTGKETIAWPKFWKTNPQLTDKDAYNRWLWNTFKDYEKKYPNGARNVTFAPKLEAYSDDAGMTLKLDQNLAGGHRSGPRGKSGTPDANKVMYDTKILDENGKPIKLPKTWEKGDDDEFLRNYLMENKDYWEKSMNLSNLLGEGPKGLKSIAKEAQKKGSPWAGMFTGETRVIPDKEYKALISSLTGHNLEEGSEEMANKVMRDAIKAHSEVGTIKKGVFKPAGEKQLKDFRKANKQYSRRADLKMPTRSDLRVAREANKSGFSRTALKMLGLGMSNNVVPIASNQVLEMKPYTYEVEPYSDDEEKK